MRWISLSLVAVALAACGSDEPDTSREAAEAWVAAVDAEDWQRACDLTDVKDRDECVAFTRRLFDSADSVTLGGLFERPGGTRFAIDINGGTTLTGFGQLTVFEHDGRFLVHLEAAAVD